MFCPFVLPERLVASVSILPVSTARQRNENVSFHPRNSQTDDGDALHVIQGRLSPGIGENITDTSVSPTTIARTFETSTTKIGP